MKIAQVMMGTRPKQEHVLLYEECANYMHQWRRMVDALANTFERDNANFNRRKFLLDCGVELTDVLV